MKHRQLAAWALALGAASAAAPSSAATGYAETRYPIVLAHGLFGYDKIAGADYYYRIPETLRQNGAAVYSTSVSAANSTAVRGEQFVAQVQTVLAVTGASKVNLIGHSQGSNTVRYAAAALPGKVASVTSVSGTVYGSKVADAVLGLTTALGPIGTAVVAGIVNALGSIIGFASGHPSLPQDTLAAMQELSTAGASKFNAAYPTALPTTPCGQGAAVVNGVSYYSWGSVGQLTNVFDITDALALLTSASFQGEANDGLVARCAMHLGTVIRDDYAANHFDTVNQSFGLTGFGFNAVTIYTQHANRLKLAGL